MKSPTTGLFRTRVAQRMMGLFLFSALVPILALGITSYVHVTDQLQDQARQRLEVGSKDAAIAVMERLHFVETELARVAATLNSSPSVRQARRSLAAVPPSGLAAVDFEIPGGRRHTLLGPASQPTELTATQQSHLRLGKSALIVHGAPHADVLLAKAVDPADANRGILWATLDPNYIWHADGDTRRLPPGTEMCVYASAEVVLTCP